MGWFAPLSAPTKTKNMFCSKKQNENAAQLINVHHDKRKNEWGLSYLLQKMYLNLRPCSFLDLDDACNGMIAHGRIEKNTREKSGRTFRDPSPKGRFWTGKWCWRWTNYMFHVVVRPYPRAFANSLTSHQRTYVSRLQRTGQWQIPSRESKMVFVTRARSTTLACLVMPNNMPSPSVVRYRCLSHHGCCAPQPQQQELLPTHNNIWDDIRIFFTFCQFFPYHFPSTYHHRIEITLSSPPSLW